MKAYATQSIRNVGIVGHGDTGKTQLVSSLLFTAGMTPRLGRVAEGSSVTDWDEEEIARKISIQTGLAYAEWVGSSSGPGASAAAEKTKLNFLDTPGYGTFVNETKCSLIAADATLILIDASHGVQVVTEKVWDYATEYDLPRAFVINWMDRDLANFERALHSVEQVFGRGVVAAQLPIGQERSFRGVVDLVTMKAHVYKPDGDGKPQIEEIPEELAEAAKQAHEKLVEIVAEGDDKLMEEFFEKGTLPVEDLLPGLRDGVQSKRIFPVLCSSALRNVGSASLLNFMVDVFPHPAMRKASGFKQSPHSMAAGAHAGTPTASQGAAKSEPIERKIADTEPLSVYVFKTMADAFAGRISYFKVMSGLLKNDATLTNFNRGTPERFQHIHATQGKTGVEVPEIHAGDIGSIAKLKETITGETLGDKSAPVFYKPVQLPEPSITFAIEPKTRADEDRVGVAIHKILEEDLALRFSRDPQTKEFLLAGSGQQHVEVIVAKLHRRYHVDLTLKPPKVPYRETIRGKADAEGKHKKQTGGHGQFGVCRVKLEPLPRGAGFEFVDDLFGGAIPKNWIPSVERGIRDTAARGYLAGFPVVDFRATLYDGKYHDVDSSDMAFRIAGSLAFKEGMKQAKPALLEPVMQVEVYAPDQYSGDIMGDLSSRRGRISGSEARGMNVVIKAQVPLAEMLSYATDLTSMTQGRASYSMEFSHYDYVPGEIADKVIAAHKAGRVEETVEEEA
ncbi:MAG TPA: elongation factor G [Candidatus Dormibacteraeota bacterium]|nr:elongation factor G [Candidatus Dormibacteraeota bacterium]